MNEYCLELINTKLDAQHKKLLDKWLDKKSDDGNNSWGGKEYSQILLEVIEKAGMQNHLLISAVGNDSLDIEITTIQVHN